MKKSTKFLFIFSIFTALSACSGTTRIAKSRPCNPGAECPIVDCARLLDQRDNAELAAKILAGVGGVSALSTAPDSVPEAARWSVGATAATAAAVSVGVIWWGARKGDEFEDYCEVTEVTETADETQSTTSELAPSPFAKDGGVE